MDPAVRRERVAIDYDDYVVIVSRCPIAALSQKG